MFLIKPFAFLKKDFLIEKSYKFAFLLNIIGVFFSILTFFYIAKLFGGSATPYLEKYGGEYFPFVLIGLAFSTYLWTGLQSFSHSIREEQLMGTLEVMFLTPTNHLTILSSLAFWEFLYASIEVILYLLIGVLCFKIQIYLGSILPALVVLILTMISFSSLGILSASFIMIFKRGDPIIWIISTGFALLGGVYYPITVLPTPLQKLSALLPITYSLNGIRTALLTDAGWSDLFPNIIALIIFSAILLPIGIIAFKYAIKRAKINGSLVQY